MKLGKWEEGGTPKLEPRAFTLIELVVVMGIIAVLTALSVAGFTNARVRAQQAKIISDVLKIQTGLQTYYQRNRTYPTKLTCSEAGDTCLSQDDLGGALPKASDGLDYPYAAPYVFTTDVDSQNDGTAYPPNYRFTGRADTLMFSTSIPAGSDIEGEKFAYPTTNFLGSYPSKVNSCAYLRGGPGSKTYAYRLGAPLLAQSSEALRDATPCSEWFYDILGIPEN